MGLKRGSYNGHEVKKNTVYKHYNLKKKLTYNERLVWLLCNDDNISV